MAIQLNHHSDQQDSDNEACCFCSVRITSAWCSRIISLRASELRSCAWSPPAQLKQRRTRGQGSTTFLASLILLPRWSTLQKARHGDKLSVPCLGFWTFGSQQTSTFSLTCDRLGNLPHQLGAAQGWTGSLSAAPSAFYQKFPVNLNDGILHIAARGCACSGSCAFGKLRHLVYRPSYADCLACLACICCTLIPDRA